MESFWDWLLGETLEAGHAWRTFPSKDVDRQTEYYRVSSRYETLNKVMREYQRFQQAAQADESADALPHDVEVDEYPSLDGQSAIQEPQPCPICDDGWIHATGATTCNNCGGTGCGSCYSGAVPVDNSEPCYICGGYGYIYEDDAESKSEGARARDE